MVVGRQNLFYSVKVLVFWQNSLYSAKWLYLGKTGCIWTKKGCIRVKVVVKGQKWLYSDKSGSIRVIVVVFSQSGCSRAKVAVIGEK